jgi:hypothetical protein
LHILFNRLSRLMMLYYDGISIPPFMATFLVGGGGKTNLAYGTAANRPSTTSTKLSDVSPRLCYYIITMAVWAEHRHKRIAGPAPGVLCCVVDLPWPGPKHSYP